MTEKKLVQAVLREGGLLLASHNKGKLRELEAAFRGDDIDILSAIDKALPEPEETENTFSGNARLKALAAAGLTLGAVLADDSGLAIDALGGAPGIYSARWAGPDRDYDMAFSRIMKELGGDEAAMGARAAFVCVLVLILPGGEELVAEGRVEGRLTFPPRGVAGFGYDPIFIPDGEERTFGEMTPAEKAGYSHRAKALAALRAELGLS
ncbi:RdgB/HAM1 family non-canonical purine NTP pyrophosphatase [Parvularcula marina]|uniref:dITP/XTP pyrophosphatase n=1 Tax=Parvularcula marina TaxID=2292771 RepID=A0A371RIE2_9PROT|nr:RdgB/HAM1 family non-canonical purine NTP pyrophosphatase [Parvularcula marina]RFB05211.1 RdgB/HAM1 family non-canonical purine NTP pyrophosphatase [Parvularcula marina]